MITKKIDVLLDERELSEIGDEEEKTQHHIIQVGTNKIEIELTIKLETGDEEL